nr:PREDICTED: adhesion G-protein coupled receptor G2-like [Paralichthys olivaceus]
MFAYASRDDSLSIIGDRALLPDFSRTVRVPKEAFGQALSLNVTVPFAAVVKFTNMAHDEKQGTVLQNEVLAVEMGATIANLTDHIDINFKNMDYRGIPSCQSWDGKGKLPQWTDEGCQTIINGTNISCQCSHLTFFAILLTPLNETISSSDLDNLTIITNVGCGLSMFFLCIVLFMHFLLRRTKATDTTKILIHLVVAMFLLNFTFLINNTVAGLKNSMGCKIMAAVMHYFMLATFTWFAVQAFHLCLQVYKGGNIVIHRYMLKVCILAWATPSVIVVFLLSFSKYGEQVIHTDDAVKDVTMCWITDENAHYIVNIGYYAIVFLFTFTTLTVMLSWLCYLKKTKADNQQANQNGISIMTIMGLCSMLGVTWGFAFFAYGDLRIPSYYIFTTLNSFQGFFLFIYYYTNRNKVVRDTGTFSDSTNASKTTSVGTDLHIYSNPYANQLEKKNP